MCQFIFYITGAIAAEAQHRDHLERHPYQTFDDEELKIAKEMLQNEMGVVKQGMGHGDLTIEAYSQVSGFWLFHLSYLFNPKHYQGCQILCGLMSI